MAKRKTRQAGPQQHAEGQHGEKTRWRFIEQLQQSTRQGSSAKPVEGHHRLHQDRQLDDEAKENSEKVEAHREVERGHDDDSVLSRARFPREGDGR